MRLGRFGGLRFGLAFDLRFGLLSARLGLRDLSAGRLASALHRRRGSGRLRVIIGAAAAGSRRGRRRAGAPCRRPAAARQRLDLVAVGNLDRDVDGDGRGWVSNSSGKPITPASTSTTAPIRRWRARRRIASMLSAGEDAATGSSTFSAQLEQGHG
jgi:hypothetical protein